MLVRWSKIAWVVLAAGSLGGCCCEPWGGCYPCGKNWCGSQCGDLYWHEWFSIPPRCCDPCDGCGNLIGPRLNDSLYSHGNDYQDWVSRRRAQFVSDPEGTVSEPAPAAEPVPVEQPGGPEPYTLPGPSDDMPAEAPADASTGVLRQHPGQRVSYEEPVAPKRRAAFQAGGPSTLRGMLQARPVDSRGPSRTLAKPPRTRLFFQ